MTNIKIRMKACKVQGIITVFLAALFFTCSNAAFAGPVILGGDDLTDHGFRVGSTNFEGWLYIEKAIGNLLGQITRSGPFHTAIAALGSSDPGAGVFPGFNAGGGINSAADVLGRSILFFDGIAAITSFFTDLASGAVNPEVVWLAGTGASNDLDAGEGAVLTANAAAIDGFVASGGGLMAHGSGSTAYGWLSALLPGIIETGGCSSGGAILTADGTAAFPGLSNSDIDSNAGPCHSHFEGDFGGLSTLALDGADPRRSYIIGTGRGGLIRCGLPGQPVCPPPPSQGGVIPEPSTLALVGIGLAGLVFLRRRSTIV